MALSSIPSNVPSVVIPAVVFCIISPLVVATRFYSRLRFSSTVGCDDWVILTSLIFAVTCNGILIIACYYGYGKHGADLPAYKLEMALEMFVISQTFYKSSINTTKASIVLLYLRLFDQKTFRQICWLVLYLVIAYGIATTLASIFQCVPVQRAWNKSIPGSCIDIRIFWYTNAALSIAGDVIILVLPMPTIYCLKLKTNQKISLFGLFALGLFVIVTSIMRMRTLDTTSKSPDLTFDIESTTWTILEMNVAVICACLPMCRLPLARLFPSVFSSTLLPCYHHHDHETGYHPNSMLVHVGIGTDKIDYHTNATHDSWVRIEQIPSTPASTPASGSTWESRSQKKTENGYEEVEYALKHLTRMPVQPVNVQVENFELALVPAAVGIRKTTEVNVAFEN